jgi:hypothetical protein
MMAPSYRSAIVVGTKSEVEFEISRIRRLSKACGWKADKCRPLYARLRWLRWEAEADNIWFGGRI